MHVFSFSVQFFKYCTNTFLQCQNFSCVSMSVFPFSSCVFNAKFYFHSQNFIAEMVLAPYKWTWFSQYSHCLLDPCTFTFSFCGLNNNNRCSSWDNSLRECVDRLASNIEYSSKTLKFVQHSWLKVQPCQPKHTTRFNRWQLMISALNLI